LKGGKKERLVLAEARNESLDFTYTCFKNFTNFSSKEVRDFSIIAVFWAALNISQDCRKTLRLNKSEIRFGNNV